MRKAAEIVRPIFSLLLRSCTAMDLEDIRDTFFADTGACPICLQNTFLGESDAKEIFPEICSAICEIE
jgi:hypothetical protein